MRYINKIVMTLAGLLLIVAAGLKFYEMIETCVPSWDTKVQAVIATAQQAGEELPQWKSTALGIWESYEFNLVQIPLEFALGVWLVSGLFRKAAWIAGTLAFFGFIFVTIGKWVTGADSCGCFGQIHVDPRITLFAMDIPIFLLLAIFRPKWYKLLPPPWPNLAWLLIVFVPTIAIMVAAPAAMVALRKDCITVDPGPDQTAPLKLEIFKLEQELEKQTQSAAIVQQKLQTQQQTIDNQQQKIQSLLEQLDTLQQDGQHTTPPDNNDIPEMTHVGTNDTADPNAEESNGTIPDENGATQQANDTNGQTPAENQWDWLQYVVEDDVRQQLTQGLVVVVMHRYDCSTCAYVVPEYSDYYKETTEQGTDMFKIAFLSIPPFSDHDHVPEDTLCIQGRLTDERDWLLTSPYVVALLNGEKNKEWPAGAAPDPENLIDEIFGE